MAQSCGPAVRDPESAAAIGDPKGRMSDAELEVSLNDFVPEAMARIIIAEARKPVALFFGATNCKACEPEFEKMKKLSKSVDLPIEGLEVRDAAVRETAVRDAAVIKAPENQIPQKMTGQMALIKVDASSGELASDFEVMSVPTILVVDGGRVLARESGSGSAERMRAALPFALRGSAK